MEVHDFFSLFKIYHPAWIQVDRRNVEQSELWLFRPLYHKTGKHAFRSEIILWQILFRVFIEPSTNQDWSKCIFLLIQTKRKLLSMMKSTNYTWNRCLTLPSSGRIWKSFGHRKQIWKSRFTKFLQKSPNFFRNFCKFFHIFLTPQCTFGTNSYMSFITGTPSKMALFQ